MSKKKLYILILILVFVFTFALFGSIAKATNGDSGEPADTSETDGDGGEDIGGLGAPIGGEEPTGLADYINRIYDFAVVTGISLAVLVIIFAGYKYMASSGDPQSTAEAKELLVGAIVGLVLILLTRLILVSIDPRILQFPQQNPLHDIQRAGPSGEDISPSPSVSPEES